MSSAAPSPRAVERLPLRARLSRLLKLARGRKAERNPWQVGTLEWTVPSPPPHHNFDRIPVVRQGPHELGNPRVIEALGRDWLAQDEELP